MYKSLFISNKTNSYKLFCRQPFESDPPFKSVQLTVFSLPNVIMTVYNEKYVYHYCRSQIDYPFLQNKFNTYKPIAVCMVVALSLAHTAGTLIKMWTGNSQLIRTNKPITLNLSSQF